MARKQNVLNRIISSMHDRGYLNVDTVLALRDWERGLANGEFSSNPRTREEALKSAKTMMKGLEKEESAAQMWVEKRSSASPESEADHRARLLSEMAICLRKGGVQTTEGGTTTKVPQLVEQMIYSLQPDLKEAVGIEAERQVMREGKPSGPDTIEARYRVL